MLYQVFCLTQVKPLPMYPGNYGDRITVDEQGIYTLNTWDGTKLEDGHYGSCNKPDNFSRFVQAWVIPETFRIVGYESNHEGVLDKDDRCADTPEGAIVDAQGCELDADQDLVVDRLDQSPDLVEDAPVDRSGCEHAQPILLRGVNFHHDTADLTQDTLGILDGVARTLLSYPGIRLEVAGHTDSDGDDAYNLDLSQRRAEAVRDYLISKGVNADMLGAHGYGEERPVEGNATAAGRAENRRVELLRLDECSINMIIALNL